MDGRIFICSYLNTILKVFFTRLTLNQSLFSVQSSSSSCHRIIYRLIDKHCSHISILLSFCMRFRLKDLKHFSFVHTSRLLHIVILLEKGNVHQFINYTLLQTLEDLLKSQPCLRSHQQAIIMHTSWPVNNLNDYYFFKCLNSIICKLVNFL